MSTTNTLLATILLGLVACSGGGGAETDWTKRKLEHKTETIKGVTVELDMPEGRKKQPPQSSSYDVYFAHETWVGPSVTLAVDASGYRPAFDDDVVVRSLKQDGELVSSEVFRNGYTYTRTRGEMLECVLQLDLPDGKRITCDASLTGGAKAKDGERTALDAVCRSIVANGVRPEPAAGAAPAAAPAAAASLPAECTAYLELMTKLASCDKLDADKRESMKFGAERSGPVWARMPADKQASLGSECKAGIEMLAEHAKTCGL